MAAERIAVFISIPKNASKYVRLLLRLGGNRDHDDTQSLVVYENHQRGLVLRTKYDLERLFTFCFVRNPYDRCVSWYDYHRRADFEPYRSLGFDEWVMRDLPHHWRRQNETDYVAENLSPLLQYTFLAGARLDFLGRVENLAHDLKQVIARLNAICQQNGMTHRFVYPDRVGSVTMRPQSNEEYYSPETKARVYSLLRKDFEVFGYAA